MRKLNLQSFLAQTTLIFACLLQSGATFAQEGRDCASFFSAMNRDLDNQSINFDELVDLGCNAPTVLSIGRAVRQGGSEMLFALNPSDPYVLFHVYRRDRNRRITTIEDLSVIRSVLQAIVLDLAYRRDLERLRLYQEALTYQWLHWADDLAANSDASWFVDRREELAALPGFYLGQCLLKYDDLKSSIESISETVVFRLCLEGGLDE